MKFLLTCPVISLFFAPRYIVLTKYYKFLIHLFTKSYENKMMFNPNLNI